LTCTGRWRGHPRGTPARRTIRVAIRGLRGLVDEATIDRLAHDCDLDVDELEQLLYAAVVAVLTTVRPAREDIYAVVDELSRTA
jgi:hypothetical protein